MKPLGDLNLYIVLLFIIIILFAIVIANSVYFTDIYNDGSENLTSSQSQSLMILNGILAILLLISCFIVIYMIRSPVDRVDNLAISTEMLKHKTEELEDKLTDVSEIAEDRNKKQQINKQITELLNAKTKPLELKNKTLKSQLEQEFERHKTLESELEEMEEEVVGLKEKVNKLDDTKSSLEQELEIHKSLLDEVDIDLKLKTELLEAKRSNLSLFSEGIFNESEYDNLFENQRLPSKSIPDLFPENASLDQILDEIPRSSFFEDSHKEKSYDYGFDVPRETTTQVGYPSYPFSRPSLSPPQTTNYRSSSYNSPIQSNTPIGSLPYKQYLPSFLNGL